MEQYVSMAAEVQLRRNGVAVDARSRQLLIDESRQVLVRAIGRTGAYAHGDYLSDPGLNSFPAGRANLDLTKRPFETTTVHAFDAH